MKKLTQDFLLGAFVFSTVVAVAWAAFEIQGNLFFC